MRIRRRVNIFFARKMSHSKEKYYIKGTKITNGLGPVTRSYLKP
jgi:hypothetical protein